MSETDEQIKERLKKWETFLESGEAIKSEDTDKDLQKKDKPIDKTVASEEKDVANEKVDVVCNEDKDSDQDTVSSVGSGYDTDDEVKT